LSEKNTPGVPGQDIDPSITTNPATQPDILEEIAKVDASVIEAMPAVERSAFRRELLSAIRRATWAAERLADLGDAEAATEPEEPAPESEEDDEGPITEPARPYRRSLALLSDGRVAMSLAYVEGADLSGYERWEGIILEPDQAEQALDSMGDAAADVAGHLGGSILWKKDEPEGGDDE
jgi:hypothetical protein